MKRWTFVLVALVLAFTLSGSAAVYKTFETVTVADTAIGLTSTTYAPDGKPQMTACLARVETAEIRMRVDGTAPTAAVGFVLSALDTFTITSNEDLVALKMIRTGGTSATVTFMCWQGTR
jgi:hypothetical protein